MTGGFRLIFWLTIIACSFLNTNRGTGQILLPPNIRSEPADMGTAAPASPGIMVGGSTPFSAPSPLQSGTVSPAPAASSSPSWFGSSKKNSLFSESFSTPQLPPPDSSFRILPGMSREEIVSAMRDEARLKNIERTERQNRLMRDIRVQQEIQKNVEALFQESESFRPKQLLKDVPAQEPKTSAASLENLRPAEIPVEKETGLSPEERIEQEMKAQRAALEKMVDSEQKQKDLAALNRREETRQRWLAQRAEAERGAILFDVPGDLRLNEQSLKDGWCMLFDGRTLFGWRTQKEGPYAGGKFSVEGDTICSDPQHPGLLYTTAQFGDSSLMFDFQAEKDSEVFLLLRTPPNPKNLHTSCYAVVLNSADPSRPRGSVLGRQRLSEEYIKHNQAALNAAQKEDDSNAWHHLDAQFDRMRLQITLDSEDPIAVFDNKPLHYGYIGLLVAKGKVRFRNMLWNPSSKTNLFDGSDLDAHWQKTGDTLKARVTPYSELQLTDGPGVLESKTTYDNFVFQCEYNIVYTSGTGAVFFRSAPKEAQTGYAVSLQNLPTRQDRDSRIGVDAGAFLGMKNARYTRPEDQRWNFLTITAVGRQFQTWINGVPVCEMSDKRPYGEKQNKEGPFPGPGTIQLALTQGGSNIQFRNIKISPLPPR